MPGKRAADNDDRKVKKKKKKDPNAPKRNVNAYMFMCKDKREEVKQNMANREGITPDKVAAKDILKELGVVWREMSAEEKKPYEKKSEADKARYLKEKAAYDKVKVPTPVSSEVEESD